MLIGVSGGADSVALLCGLRMLRSEFSLRLRVAHLNHKLRGAASDSDADWVRALADTLQIEVEVGTVENDLTRQRESVETAAREARHLFLHETAARFACHVIAVAHTIDDQNETILHHLFRGTGISGLRGIPSERPLSENIRLVRPMLSIGRRQVEAFLMESGQDYRTDATNSDTSLTRNWLRHELLPQLRSHFGDKVELSLLRLSQQAGEVEATLSTLADRLLNRAILDLQPGAARLDSRAFENEPQHLVRESFVRLWHRQSWPRQSMGYDEWNRLAMVAIAGGSTNLPGGLIARRSGTSLLTIVRS